jgi:hypothetical protein
MSFDHLVGAHYNKWRHSEAESRGVFTLGAMSSLTGRSAGLSPRRMQST